MINGHEIMMGRTANEVVANLPTRVSHRVWQWIKDTPDAIALQEAARSWTYADLGLARIFHEGRYKNGGIPYGSCC